MKSYFIKVFIKVFIGRQFTGMEAFTGTLEEIC